MSGQLSSLPASFLPCLPAVQAHAIPSHSLSQPFCSPLLSRAGCRTLPRHVLLSTCTPVRICNGNGCNIRSSSKWWVYAGWPHQRLGSYWQRWQQQCWSQQHIRQQQQQQQQQQQLVGSADAARVMSVHCDLGDSGLEDSFARLRCQHQRLCAQQRARLHGTSDGGVKERGRGGRREWVWRRGVDRVAECGLLRYDMGYGPYRMEKG